MPEFKGFSAEETFTRIPDTFFRELLAGIDDPAELKVALWALWRFEHMEGSFRALPAGAFAAETGLDPAQAAAGLERAVARGVLLQVERDGQSLVFLNSPRGRAAAEAFRKGERAAPQAGPAPAARPNVFSLYEQNIGPLTPLIADALREAEAEYPAEWIEEALREAVANNKRSWKYAAAILRRWKEEGRHAQEQDRRHTEEDRRKYVEGEYSDFVEH